MIDTNIIITILTRSEKIEQARSIFNLLKDEEMVITLGILEEVAYVGLSCIYGYRAFKLRDALKKGLNLESINFLEGLESFIKKMQIGIISLQFIPAIRSCLINGMDQMPLPSIEP